VNKSAKGKDDCITVQAQRGPTEDELTEAELEAELEVEHIFLTGDVARMTDDSFTALIEVILRDTPSAKKKALHRALWAALQPIADKFVPEPELEAK